MAIKVKIFEDSHSYELQQKVENYVNNLSSFDTKVTDIKYSIANNSNCCPRIYSAMVITERV